MRKKNKKSSENEWIFCKNKLPTENYTIDIYGLRKKSDNEDELIEGIYEDGKFMKFNEITTNMEEIDSIYAWKYKN